MVNQKIHRQPGTCISDLYNRKHVIMVALALYALGKAVCGLAVSMEMLICGRCLSGLGAATRERPQLETPPMPTCLFGSFSAVVYVINV